MKERMVLLLVLVTISIAQAEEGGYYDKSGEIQVRFLEKVSELKAGSAFDTGKRKEILKNDVVCIGGSFRVSNRGKEMYNIKTSVFLLNGHKKIFRKMKLYTRENDPRSRAPALLHIQAKQAITLFLMPSCIDRGKLVDKKPVYIKLMDFPHFWDVVFR